MALLVNDATLFKLEMNDAMKRAIARCHKERMRALRVSFNQIVVKHYTVNVYAPKPGVYLASCNCEATGVCKHIAAACVVPGTAICEAFTQAMPPITLAGAQPRSAAYRRPSNSLGDTFDGFQI